MASVIEKSSARLDPRINANNKWSRFGIQLGYFTFAFEPCLVAVARWLTRFRLSRYWNVLKPVSLPRWVPVRSSTVLAPGDRLYEYWNLLEPYSFPRYVPVGSSVLSVPQRGLVSSELVKLQFWSVRSLVRKIAWPIASQTAQLGYFKFACELCLVAFTRWLTRFRLCRYWNLLKPVSFPRFVPIGPSNVLA